VDTATYSKVATAMSNVDIDAFYLELVHELAEFARKGGTGIGAAAVVKRVALAFGVTAAEWVPVPRLTRAEQAELGVVGASNAVREESGRERHGCGAGLGSAAGAG